jgi:hypothetical protein
MIYYVALPFTAVEEGGLAPGEAVECPNPGAALRKAESLARAARTLGHSHSLARATLMWANSTMQWS